MRHRYDRETKERAVRMFQQRREEQPEESRKQALKRLSDLLGVPPDTIRGWVDRARVDVGEKPGVTTGEREEIRALRKELAEVKRANEILKTASAFFAAAELDRRLICSSVGPAWQADADWVRDTVLEHGPSRVGPPG